MTAAAASGSRSTAAADGPIDRRHTEHGRERKQQLVDAAAELFADNGYAATRIQDICRRAGVAKGLFYWYFPTKQELFAELVRTMRLRLRKAQAQAMDSAADPLTRIRQGAEASVRFHAEHAGRHRTVRSRGSVMDPRLGSGEDGGVGVRRHGRRSI